MSWYKPCPCCGANLDPHEICFDCKEKAAPKLEPSEAAQGNLPIPNITYTGGNVKCPTL